MSLPEQTRPVAQARRTPGKDAVLGWLLGILAGLLGLAPWLITGAQLPLQNLWGTEVLPDQMPVSLLPMSRQILAATLGPDGGALPAVLLALTVGLAGLGIRALAARRRLGNPSGNQADPTP